MGLSFFTTFWSWGCSTSHWLNFSLTIFYLFYFNTESHCSQWSSFWQSKESIWESIANSLCSSWGTGGYVSWGWFLSVSIFFLCFCFCFGVWNGHAPSSWCIAMDESQPRISWEDFGGGGWLRPFGVVIISVATGHGSSNKRYCCHMGFDSFFYFPFLSALWRGLAS